MENITQILEEPAKLSQVEVDQIARLMENIKQQRTNTNESLIKPPIPVVPPIVVDTKTITNTPPPLTKEQYDRIKNSPPVPIPTETMAKLQAVGIANIANERASREPFPDSTSEVFDPVNPEIEVFNIDKNTNEIIKVRGIVPADLRTFKLTNSPLYKLIVGELQREEDAISQFTVDQDTLYDLCYQFMIPSREAAKLAKRGAEAFHEVSFELAHKYSSEDLMKICLTVMNFIGKVNNAKAQFSAAPEINEKGEIIEDKKKL